ncbi:hypothetical protein BC940DRAFT_144935 [Gongronella butleri]|nr:hypothetical protein BC940DRAFT_144935 [Gongronella butleri]
MRSSLLLFDSILAWLEHSKSCPNCRKHISHNSHTIPLYIDLTQTQTQLADMSHEHESSQQEATLQKANQELRAQLSTATEQLKKAHHIQEANEALETSINRLQKRVQSYRNLQGVAELTAHITNDETRAKIRHWETLPRSELTTMLACVLHKYTATARENASLSQQQQRNIDRIRDYKDKYRRAQRLLKSTPHAQRKHARLATAPRIRTPHPSRHGKRSEPSTSAAAATMHADDEMRMDEDDTTEDESAAVVAHDLPQDHYKPSSGDESPLLRSPSLDGSVMDTANDIPAIDLDDMDYFLHGTAL